jgi:Tfp pilus assembly protein PilE
MSVIQLMVTIIIVTILVTVILGVVSYAAYWLRRMRRPARSEVVETEPRFFYRFVPDGTSE